MNNVSGIKRTADCIVEGSCLVAVISLPLYFSVLTETGYEPDKAVLLRILASVAGAAWLCSALAVPSSPKRGDRFGLIAWLATLGFLTYALATVLSIDPRLSFWGSHTRQDGLVTRAAYLVLFLVVATRFRHTDAVNHLITALILGSVPAVVYGLLQQFGSDPVPSTGDPSTLYWPVRSSFGQHIFFASYLIMIIPFTAARIAQYADAWWEKERQRPALLDLAVGGCIVLFMLVTYFALVGTGVRHPALFAVFPGLLAGYAVGALALSRLPHRPGMRLVSLASCALLLALQIVTLFFTGARGAWLGFLAGVLVFVWLTAKRGNRRTTARSVLAVAAAGGVVILLLNIPGGPLQPLRTAPGLNRIANITDSGGAGGSAKGRVLIWQGVGQLMTEDPSIGDTWGGIGRDIVGYGPESLHWAFQAVYPVELRRLTSEIWTWDRAHDIYLDYLVDAGILGLLAFVALIIVYFRQAMVNFQRVERESAWIVVAGVSAVVAHLVDGAFGIEEVVTLLILWIIMGQAAALPFGLPSETPEIQRGALGVLRSSAWLWIALAAAAVVLAAVPSSDFHANVLGAVLLIATLAGTGAVAFALAGSLSVPRPSMQWRAGSPVARSRGLTMALFVAVLLALTLSSQARFQAAAFAYRAGLDRLAGGQPVQALGYMQAAAQENGNDPQYETNLGAAYASMAPGHLDSSDPGYQPAPADTKTLEPARANGLSSSQLFALSRYSLEEARRLSPLDPDAYDNLGNLALETGDLPGALSQYRQAAALSLDNPRYLDRIALAQLQAGQATAAAQSAQSALGLDSTYWYSHYVMSLIEDRSGSRQTARQEASIALATVPNYWPPPPAQEVAQLHTLQRSG